MNEITDVILDISYKAQWNVYLVWALGLIMIYSSNRDMSINIKKMSHSKLVNHNYRGIKINAKLVRAFELLKIFIKTRAWQIIIIPFLGLINDFFVMKIWEGGSAVTLYSKLWWGQFLSFSNIVEILQTGQ